MPPTNGSKLYLKLIAGRMLSPMLSYATRRDDVAEDKQVNLMSLPA
ncbi:hypothetical protein yberc0001_31760 [Yersinia bercovieri ATCC 43970]|uniref:Uncharacterized protein n=1 Tax=Yersinia bercovieri ATCC 43970 TaxID=349968 RepID=A0ABM9Y0Z8_YERBE|nr:hypothetical protein yberc0001_31760 [Yersinia bercovieri ATCC 43970]